MQDDLTEGKTDLNVVLADDLPGAIVRHLISATRSVDLFLEGKNLAAAQGALASMGKDNGSLSKIKDLQNRAVRMRCITEVVQENLPYCVEMMKYFELYHVNLHRGNFLLLDGREYAAFLAAPGRAETEGRILISTNQSFVESQLFLASLLISNAVPARQRISEIAKGVGEEFMETIRDPARVKSLISELSASAIYEICILFSTRESLYIAIRESIIELLDKAASRGVKVKVLVMYDGSNTGSDQISKEEIKSRYPNIVINYLQQFLPTKITTMLVDQAKSLTIEVNDDSAQTLEASIGLCTYSNSESTVFSNASIFESLWIQSELDKQNKARQVYFQLFKGFKLKNEVYDRKWSESEGKENNPKE